MGNIKPRPCCIERELGPCIKAEVWYSRKDRTFEGWLKSVLHRKIYSDVNASRLKYDIPEKTEHSRSISGFNYYRERYI